MGKEKPRIVRALSCLYETLKSFLHLIGETKVHTKRREDKALEGLAGSQAVGVLGDGVHVLPVEVDQVGTVGLDAGGSDGLGENRGATSNWK